MCVHLKRYVRRLLPAGRGTGDPRSSLRSVPNEGVKSPVVGKARVCETSPMQGCHREAVLLCNHRSSWAWEASRAVSGELRLRLMLALHVSVALIGALACLRTSVAV